MTNVSNSVLYIGVTNNIFRRVIEHKNHKVKGFSSKYRLHKIIYYEHYYSIIDAINREKQLKNWHREWKLNLIKEENPNFKDLFIEWNSNDLRS